MILTTTIIHAYYFDDSFKNPYIENLVLIFGKLTNSLFLK